MVEGIRGRLTDLGLDNAEARVLDAEDLDVGDAEFDAVLCRFGYMLTSDPARALSETFRVLVPGGRLALGVWGTAEENPWLGLPMKTLMEHLGAPPPEPGMPGPCSLGDRNRVVELLDGAGFDDVTVEQLEAEDRFADADEWWDRTLALAAPFTAALSNLPAESAQELEAKAKASGDPFRADDGSLVFPAAVNVASARRPG
jgi:SAM-dependent methyltransferase